MCDATARDVALELSVYDIVGITVRRAVLPHAPTCLPTLVWLELAIDLPHLRVRFEACKRDPIANWRFV